MAASSLMDSMRELGAACAARGHPAPRFVFAASSVLIRQVEHGVRMGIVRFADRPQALVALLTGAEAAPAHGSLGCSIRQ